MVDLANIRPTRAGVLPVLRAVRRFCAEYQRALAAEDLYACLKHTNASALAQGGFARCDIPRRVFDEFYALSAGDRRLGRHSEKSRNSVMRITNGYSRI